MNNHYLLNFGDSWAHGADAGYEKRYATLMAQKLNMTLIDYSIPSTSAPRMVVELQQFLQNSYNPNNFYTALFFITAQERQLLFTENGTPRDLTINNDAEYYKKFYTSRLGNYTLNTTIITLQVLCQKYNIKDYYLLGWLKPTLWAEVDIGRFYNNGRTNALNVILQDSSNINFYGVDLTDHPGFINGHPSIIGHQRISDEWLAWINVDSLSPEQ